MPSFNGIWTANQQFQAVGGSTWPSFPGAPTAAVATVASGTSVSVAFTAPSSAGFPATITGYIVTSSPGGLTGTGSSSPIVVTGLTTDTAYTFTVSAINATGTGPSSAASSSVTPVNAFVEDVFSTYIYEGNNGTQTIANGIDLTGNGGLVWIKDRTQTWSNLLVDSARGNGNALFSDSTSGSTAGYGVDLASNGFTLTSGDNISNKVRSYISWTFRKQPKFFDIVTYTGNGTNGKQISHSLGSAPGMIWVKRTDATRSWVCFHRSLGTGGLLKLNQDIVAETNTALWNSITPTSSYFEVNNDLDVNASGGTYVAYLFAHDAGGFGLTGTDNVISCGTFTGNTTVNLGFEPQWILLKNSGGVGNWYIHDTMRGWPVSGDAKVLYPNLTSAESGTAQIFPNATGFSTSIGGGTYIYIAIRRGPMKVPTVGTNVFLPQTRSGTAASATVTGVGFAPDLTIFNTRNRSALAWNFPFCDRLRGPQQQLHSNTTAAQAKNDYGLLEYTMDGMILGNDGTDSGINYSTSTYANYFFKRAPGFFDEVCYTGTGSATTQTHNLGVVPELMITKSRSAINSPAWGVYHSALGNTKYLNFLTASADVNASYWNNTTPTGSVFTVNSNGAVNASGQTYVAYLFATCAGVSKVGSYTGNGTTQTINCGFTAGARFVLIKRTDDTGGWYTYDTARGMTSGTAPYSLLNAHTHQTGNMEVDTSGSVTTVSTGFALSSAGLAAINVNAGTYIFLAIA